jgi:hypothetical protein
MRAIVFIPAVLLLGACAYALDDSIQDVRFETPGAQNAKCFVYVDGVKYTVHPPQKLNLAKTKKPLEIDCMAPGNRRKKIFIEPATENSAYYNAANLGIGVPVDYASGAMFRYPNVITVDFTTAPIVDSGLPAHDSPELRKADSYKLEEFSAGVPSLNSDGSEPKAVLLKRGQSESSAADQDPAAFSEPTAKSKDKGDLKALLNKILPNLNPKPDTADSKPTPLFPGQ